MVLLLMVSRLCAYAEAGLAVEFRQGEKRDHAVLPFAALYVAQEEAPTRFLEKGPFSAVFTGWISVDLRAQYTFSAEVAGSLELLINGREVLKVADGTRSVETGRPVRLSKGTNSFVARFASRPAGEGMVKIMWASRNHAVPVPIPASALTHRPGDELQRARAVRNGAFLVEQYRCGKCHLGGGGGEFDSPSLEGVWESLNPGWLAKWILDPAAQREARMPQLFHGPDAEKNAEAVAAYLSAPKTSMTTTPLDVSDAMRERGAELFEELRCGSCHTAPGGPPSEERVALNHAAEKFKPQGLVAFLRNPQHRYSANPMPNFRLSIQEANALAAFFLGDAPKVEETNYEAAMAEKGRALVQTSGCLNCHALDMPNQFKAPAFSELIGKSETGCLSGSAENAPRFKLAPGEKEDIEAFLAAASATAFTKSSPLELAIRYTLMLRCAACHQESGLPDPLILGGKLKPDWAEDFIAGKVNYKPRPWLKERMPSFPAYASALARGLAAIHGNPAASPSEPEPNPEMVEIGAKLVSTGGFSCVACHAVRESAIGVVVESPGVNLAYSGERLLPGFFHRWLMNPIAIEPGTKMPVYFDEQARSQLIEIFDGDARKQIEAMWQYIRLGDKMPLPPAP